MAKSPKRRMRLGERNSSGINTQYLGDPLESLASDAASISPDLDAQPSSSTAAPAVAEDTAAAEQATETLAQETEPAPGPVAVPVGEGSLAPAVTAEPEQEDLEEVVGEWPVAAIPQAPAPEVEDEQHDTSPEASAEGSAPPAAQDQAPATTEQPVDVVAAEAAPEKVGEESVPAPAAAEEPPAPEPITQPAKAPAGEGSAVSAPAIHPSALTVADAEAERGLEQYSNPLIGPRATTVTTGVSFSRTSLDYAKRAFSSDKHRIPGGGPNSFARWLQRAVHQHLALSPEEREAALESAPAPDDGGRKISYNVPLPYHLHHELMAELNRAEMEGWQVNKSAFIREAVAVAIGQALVRANVTQFPPLKGKLKHAR